MGATGPPGFVCGRISKTHSGSLPQRLTLHACVERTREGDRVERGRSSVGWEGQEVTTRTG